MTHNKLVRDKIPEIMQKNGQDPVTRILGERAYHQSLCQKLQEEIDEYLESHDAEELADIIEIVYALAKTQNISVESLEHTRLQKREKHGGFEKRIFLVEAFDDDSSDIDNDL